MVINLFENFLDDPRQYELSEKHWNDLWSKINPAQRSQFLWSTPWLGTGSPSIRDGNPIFSAFSPLLRRGIRIIQQEPVEPGLDFQFWLDTFGGDSTESDSIHELVIACVLSDVATFHTRTFMALWIGGGPISFNRDFGGQLMPNMPRRDSADFRRVIDNAA